jgi:hypothetical protein
MHQKTDIAHVCGLDSAELAVLKCRCGLQHKPLASLVESVLSLTNI